MKSLQIAVLKTLVYADIFDYPLTDQEIWRFLICNFQLPISKFQINFKSSNSKFQRKDKYFFINNREEIITTRNRRDKICREKIKIAWKTAKWLKIIPWIKMVAVTGSLAINNSDENDDIDLLIVSSQSRLWLTRLFAVILTEIFGNRRRPNDKQFKDKICLNIFLDENHLQVPKIEQDLYSAHEVVQLKPIWDRNGIYQNFLIENYWIKKYLPNAIEINRRYQITNGKNTNKILNILNLICIFAFCFLNFNIFEKLAYHLQLFYMKSKKSTEITESGRVLFHPQDARKWILVEYGKRLEKLKAKD